MKATGDRLVAVRRLIGREVRMPFMKTAGKELDEKI